MARAKGSSGNSKVVIDALTEHGPMTNRALVALTGIPRKNMDTLLFQLHRKPRLIYIHSWEELSHDGFYTRPHAAYAVGIRPDARKPPPLGNTVVNRRRRNNLRVRVNSIFNLGAVNVDQAFKERAPVITHRAPSGG